MYTDLNILSQLYCSNLQQKTRQTLITFQRANLSIMASGDPKLGQLDSWRKDEITVSGPDNDVPTLYHTDMSYYSQVTRLVLEEEGVLYRSRGVDIHNDQEQIQEWYMKINPKAVVPTLMYR